MKRSELRRGKPLSRTTGLTRRTAMPRQPAQPVPRQRTAHPAPQDTRTAISDRSGGVCEVGLLGVCAGVATDWHHRQRRREGDHRPVNALHVCRFCHAWAHQHPVEARHWGWIVSAWANPAAIPVRVRGRSVRLTPDGRYEPCPKHPATRDETSPDA